MSEIWATTDARYQLLPPLSEAEFAALKGSIAEHGIRVPIELDEQGRVLDGHHRTRAWNALRADGVVVGDYPSIIRAGLSEDEKRAHVLMLNLYRRHLTPEARGEIIRGLRSEGMTLQAIAEVAGVAVGTVHADLAEDESAFQNRKAERTVGKDGKSYPTRYRHRDIVAKNRREAGRAAAAIAAVGAEALPAGLIDVKRAERIAREAQAATRRETELPPRPSGSVDLRHADFRTALEREEPGSVDLILTDPPYLAEYLPLWDDLARVALRLLKPGGLLVAYSGQYHLPAVMAHLATHLTYVWTGTLVMPGLHVQVHPRAVFTNSKPVLMYAHGEYQPPFWFGDTFISDAQEKADHDWQQPLEASRFFVGQLSRPDWLIVDPFLGAGTNAVAALELGRRFIGCDVDAAAIASTWERVDASGAWAARRRPGAAGEGVA
jgi:ParB-like chromosome segregation protein Spo0J